MSKSHHIEVYSRGGCSFSTQVVRLLDKKNLSYKQYDIWSDPKIFEEMKKRANNRTSVPQIFIDDKHIGGCDDLMDLERTGKLDKLLA